VSAAGSRRWFGTDGIRARAGEEPLVPAFLQRLGRALGDFAAAQARDDGAPDGSDGAHDGSLVLIARDTRESGPAIVQSLCTGLLAAGARVVDLGVLPTAGLPVAMRARRAALGVVVSASHNPWADNGIKVFGAGGSKLSDETEERLEAAVLALGGTASLSGGPAARAPAGARAGAVDQVDGAADYRLWLLARFAELDLSGLAVAVDCAHGAASRTAAAVLAGLGARVTALFDAPDGRNINAGCGSTHLAPLAGHLRAGREDFGLAFDGDADRVLGVDRAGRTCDGDHMLGFLGPWLAARGELPGGIVVASVMSNLGLERLLAARGVRMLRCPVGDRHVLHALRAGGYGLGGEAAGHLLFREGAHYIGDGLFTALRLMAALAETHKPFAQLIDDVARVPQVLLNVPVASRPPVEGLLRLNARVAEEQARHGADLRIVLRYSGTENLARVMVEGVDGALVERLSGELAALWTDEIAARVAGRVPGR
jgi:phosphoglucosamine mutase